MSDSIDGRTRELLEDRNFCHVVTMSGDGSPHVTIRGRAVEVTADGADEHIDALGKKYLGKDQYPFRKEGEVRLKIHVRPEKVRLRGGN